jgi:hypothetical protein
VALEPSGAARHHLDPTLSRFATIRHHLRRRHRANRPFQPEPEACRPVPDTPRFIVAALATAWIEAGCPSTVRCREAYGIRSYLADPPGALDDPDAEASSP